MSNAHALIAGTFAMLAAIVYPDGITIDSYADRDAAERNLRHYPAGSTIVDRDATLVVAGAPPVGACPVPACNCRRARNAASGRAVTPAASDARATGDAASPSQPSV